MNKKIIIAVLIIGIIFIGVYIQNSKEKISEESITTVKGVGGSAMLDIKCTNETYLKEISDYIVKGVITNVESKENEDKTLIFTYSDINVDEYAKGEPFENNKLQIATPGGCVDDVCLAVEDQPIFHEGEYVQIYFHKRGNEFSIVCGFSGIKQIS